MIDRRKVLQGYELYLVEQWACSRQSPTLVIVTYTGDPRHSVVVGVLAVPAEEKDWSPRLRVYFKAIQQYHARPRETELGELMVTNLSSFPSALTVIATPDGDIRKHRQIFIVNEDLKRLGCSGRSGMTLSEPTPATQAKFMQLYKTSDRIPFDQSVLELVKLCQVALFIFGKLEQEYIDGLLCDVTESAINNWWTEVGSEYFNIEPTDGILGPTTVAALLGTLIGARNRLRDYGAPIGKDVFDINSTKRGIGAFQKTNKLERTRRLDRQTLLKLHSVTAKAAAKEGGWGVQKAVKSTLGEFGGKKGELMIGMVGGREKANIGDVETTDLDKFIGLVHGERAKWLWHGKPRRTVLDTHDHTMPEMGNLLFGKDTKEAGELAPVATMNSKRTLHPAHLDDDVDARRREEPLTVYSAPPAGSTLSMIDSPSDRDALKKNVFKSVAGKVSDARSGFGRFRDAVGGGLRGHSSRPSKDDATELFSPTSGHSISSLAQTSSAAALASPAMVGRTFTWKNKPAEYIGAMNAINAMRRENEAAESAPETGTGHLDSDLLSAASRVGTREPDELEKLNSSTSERDKSERDRSERDKSGDSQTMEVRQEFVIRDSSVAGSVVDENDLKGPILTAELGSSIPLCPLQRRHSITVSVTQDERPRNEARYARRLSFSDGEEAILRWPEVVVLETPGQVDITSIAFPCPSAELAMRLHRGLTQLQHDYVPWVESKIEAVESLDNTLAQQAVDLQALYYSLSDEYQSIKQRSGEQLADERATLTEAIKDVEALVARLDYEIGALVGKVHDVEENVTTFESQVEDMERRADELKTFLETESWLHWFVRTLTGIGTGPNITRGHAEPARAEEPKN